MKKQKAIICDLDGTLCNTDHRQHFMAGPKKDWKGFFGAMAADPIHAWCKELLNAMGGSGYQVIFVTGRPEIYRIPTVDWLVAHKIYPYMFRLFMRDDGGQKPDHEVKERIYRDQIEPQWDVRFVVDDRKSVVEMWRRIGLTCLQCAPGEF